MKNNKGFLLSAIALGLTAANTGTAQVLEETLVTAQKRTESMQDVPVSMIAKSGESIKDFAVTKGADFSADIPAVTIAQNPIGNFVFIRGVGTAGTNQAIEQSVSIFHDNIYMGRHQLSRAPFMDLARVEVLRGPQSIMFGKNTIGGAIHVISAKPTDEVEGMISGVYGWEDGEQEITGVISGPITENLSGRLSYRGYKMDGYLENVMTGSDAPERDDQTLRAQLAFDATDNLSVSFKWERSEFEQTETSTQLAVIDPFDPTAVAASALNGALVAAATGGNGEEKWDNKRAVDNDGGALLGQVVPEFAGVPGFPAKQEGSDNEMDVGSLTFDLALGDHQLTAITGYAQYEYRDICDCDFAAIPLVQADAAEDYDQFSQEIRLTSPGGEVLDYIVGLYYQQSDLEFRSIEGFGSNLLAGPAGVPGILAPNVSRDYTLNQDQEMWAVFGSVTWNFAERTRATFGLRYSDESKEADHTLDKFFTGGWDYSALAGLPAGSLAFGDTPAEYDRFLATPGLEVPAVITEDVIFADALGTWEHEILGRKRDEDFITWSVTLEQDVGDDAMIFATVSTGVKGGGFDGRFLRATDDDEFFEYDEEEAMNYELGIKSTLLDGAMRLNATAFFITVDDYQVSIFDGATAFFVQNAAEIESKGVEMDVKWAATDQLTVSLAFTWLDNEYSDFPNAPCWAGTVENNRGDCIGRGTEDAHRDASGEINVFSPEWAYNLNLDYYVPVGDSLEARATLNVNYSDEYSASADLDPIYAHQDDYTTVDLRLALGDVNGAWDLALIGKNLTDEYISGTTNDQPLVPGNGFAQTNRLRSYAIQASYRF